jgi:hypothetical protein
VDHLQHKDRFVAATVVLDGWLGIKLFLSMMFGLVFGSLPIYTLPAVTASCEQWVEDMTATVQALLQQARHAAATAGPFLKEIIADPTNACKQVARSMAANVSSLHHHAANNDSMAEEPPKETPKTPTRRKAADTRPRSTSRSHSRSRTLTPKRLQQMRMARESLDGQLRSGAI